MSDVPVLVWKNRLIPDTDVYTADLPDRYTGEEKSIYVVESNTVVQASATDSHNSRYQHQCYTHHMQRHGTPGT